MKAKFDRRSVLKGSVGLGMAGFGLMSGLGSPGANAAELLKIRVVNAQGSFGLVKNLIFKEQKFFEKRGVEPELVSVSDGSKIIAALVSGAGDVCTAAGFAGVFPAIEKGAKIKIIAGSGIAPTTMLYASNKFPEIQSVKDLVGHTVGTGAPGALLHELAVADLKKHGVDYTKVKFVNIGSSRSVFKQLAGGNVDAGVAPLEVRADADKFNIHPLVDGEFAKELPLFTNQAMFATDEAIVKHREALIRLLAANADMFRWIQNPASKETFIEYYKRGIGAKATQKSAEFFQSFMSRPGALASDLVMSKDQIDYVQGLNVELGVQKTVLPFEQVADMSLAQEAVKLLKA